MILIRITGKDTTIPIRNTTYYIYPGQSGLSRSGIRHQAET